MTIDDSTPDHIYMDINVYNKPGVNDADKHLQYTEIRNNLILDKPSDYFMSVVRFSLETGSSLPIWVPKIEPGLNGLVTVYKFYLKYKLISGQVLEVERPVVWWAEDFTQKMGDENYYFAYSSLHIINIFNATLKMLFNDMTYLVESTSPGEPFNKTKGAFFTLDGDRWVLNADYELFDYPYLATYMSTHKAQLLMNNSLYNLMSSFPCYKMIDDKFLFNMFNNNNTNLLVVPLNVGLPESCYLLQLAQEYNSNSLFCPVKSLVFKTNLLPVSYTLSTAPLTLNQTNNFLSEGSNANLDNVLTDFEADMVSIDSYMNILQYVNTGEYRLIDLMGNQAINQVDISVFWKDEESALHPLYLPSGRNFNIKIMFRKKSYNKNI